MSTREERLKKLQEYHSRSDVSSSGKSVSVDPERQRREQMLQDMYVNDYLPKQVNAWSQEMNEFSKKISADAQARSKGYQSPDALKAYQDSINGQLNDLISRSKYAQQYASLNPNDINFNTGIKDTLNYLNNITKSLQNEQAFWSQWANEDAYKKSAYYFDNEYAEKAKNYNTDPIKARTDAFDDFFVKQDQKDPALHGMMSMQEFAEAYGFDKDTVYNELTDNEARMYAYIRDTEGLDEARRYLQSIVETLSYRQGAKKAQTPGSWMGLVNPPEFLKTIIGLAESGGAGLENALAGLGQTTANMFGNKDYVAMTPSSVYAHQIRQENASDFEKVLGDLMFTTGNMLPSIGVSAVSKSPLLGAGITAMSSGGNAYSEARRQGYSHEQATAYGMINGALEGGLQYALGGIGKLGGKLSGKLINKIGDKLLPAFSNIKSGVARAVLSAGGKFLGNAASEAFEEGLQSVLDPLVRSMVLQEDLNIDWNEVGYSAMLGALSAGLWEGGSIVSNSVQANTIGKKAFENGSWQGALDYALALDPNSTPYKLAKGLQDGSIKADGNNVGNLYSALVEYMQESSKLVRKGKMTTDQYVSAQNAISQIYEARSKAEAENNASADISPNIMSASLYQEIKGLGLDEKTSTKYSNAIANLKQGTEVSGKITNELINGNSPVKDIVARELGIDTTNKTAAELRNAVKTYVESVKSQPKTETAEQTAPKTEKELQYEQAKAATAEISKALGEKGQAVYNEFSEGMRTGDSLMYFNNAVFDFYNQGVEASLKKNPPKKYIDIEGYEGIAPVIKQRAFEAGKLDNATKAEAVKKTEEKVKSDIKEIKARQRELKHVEFDIKDLAPSAGKWTVDEDVDVDNLKGKQNAAFNYLKAVSEVSGINVHIMSGVNENGELTAENGFYDSNTNTVYVSINAGAQSLTDIANTAVLKTASHEITHYIAATDTDAYQELRDYVVETFKKEHGEDGLARRISDIQEIYKDQINKDLSYEKAIEEMVANACETMIRNSKVFSQLARQNMTVAERLKDGLDRFIAKMDENREAALKGIKETSLEARLIASNADTLKKAQALWDNALKAAIKKNQTVPDSKVTNATTEVQNTNVMQNLRTMTEDYWAYRDDVVLKGLMTSQEYDKLFNSINVIMDMARKNPDILDFGADIDSNNRPFSAIKPNSDPLYKVSLDFSTLCRKRLLQQAIVNRLQAKLKRSLTATEQTQIRNELVKLRKEGKKIEVACALCYVEAARLKSPDVINDFLENRRKYAVDYFSKKNKEFNKLIAKKQGDYLASQGIKRDAKKSEMGKDVADYLDTNKPIWRQEYKPTANEEAAIKILEDMDAAELLSVQGLAKLRLANPVAYDIYISRVRTATKSKAQETNMPFKRGDTYGFVDGNGKKTKAISKKLIADMNAENGLRYQSWSDFQAMHILDNIAAVMELATRGAKMQTYTKVPDFVTLNGKTGMMINMSLLAKGNGFNADGSFAFDPIEGMPFEEMQKLRDQFPETAGNIIVAVSNDHLRALLANNDIDYVIPYHLSGLNENLRLMMSIEDWVDYTRTQGEKSNGAENVNGVKMWHKAPKFSEWFDAEAAAKADDGYAFMREAAQKYLALCEERGLVPKFDEFKTEENYWKLLIDRKMVNHKTGKVIIQNAVKPIFDENAITVAQNAIADEQAIKDFREVQDSLVEQITSGKVKISDKMTAELVAMQNAPFTSEMETESDGRMMSLRYDAEYMDAVQNGNMRTAKNLVKDAAVKWGAYEQSGKPVELYRGSPKWGKYVLEEDFIFATPDPVIAEGYGYKWYAHPRELHRQYIPDDGTAKTLIKNAKNVLDRQYRAITDQDIKDIFDSIGKTAQELSQKIDNAWTSSALDVIFAINKENPFRANADTDSGEIELQNAIDYILTLPGDVSAVYDDFLNGADIGEYERQSLAYAVVKFNHHREDLRNWFGENNKKIMGTDAQSLYKIVMSYDLSDFAVDTEYKLIPAFNKTNLISDTGSITTTDAISRDIEQQKNIGAYVLYGKKGDRPLVIDGGGRVFTNIVVPEWGGDNLGYSTDYIAKRAKEEGYTSVWIKNIFDVAMNNFSVNKKGDVYIFFGSDSVKSADVVTYDDNNKVIPLSERFSDTEKDIRYSLRYDETELNARRELSSALLTVAQTDAERTKLEVYQKMVKTLTEQEELLGKMKDKLAQIDKAKEFKRYTELEKNIRGVENKINHYDSKLINLEATAPIKAILERREARLKEQFARSSTTRAKHRNSIKQKIRSLDQKLRTNSGEKHILKDFQPVVAQLLDVFTNNTSVFKADQLEKLHTIYGKFKPDSDEKIELGNESVEFENEDIENDPTAYMAYYAPVIEKAIKTIAPIVENKRLIDLDAETLAALDNIISNIHKMIVHADDIFVGNRTANIREISEDSMLDMKASGFTPGKTQEGGKVASAKEFFEYKNALPVYVMERLGYTVMEYLWKPLEEASAQMIREQVIDTNFLQGKMRQYGYESWKNDAKRITLESGQTITITDEIAMYIYAVSKREASHRGIDGKQINHLGKGGIVLPKLVTEVVKDENGKAEKYLGIIPKKRKTLRESDRGIPLTDADISKIKKALTENQRKYVDDVVKYLSTTIADRGNATSQKLYGIDLFNEEYYIPLMSKQDYLNISFMGQTDRLIKNAGMTKSLTAKASNPIVVDDFTSIVARHLLQMERYDTLAVPLDNFNRWLNYLSRTEDSHGNLVKNGDGVRVTMNSIYGAEMKSYITQLLRDANASSTQASNESIGAALLGKFRKNAVLASLSVAIQQPSAMARVLAYMSPKYIAFRTGWTNYRENYEELLKYSGAAFVKEHGSFDPAVSTNALADMMYLEPEGWQKLTKLFTDSKHRDEVLSALPKMMDRITWLRIWQAVKAETADLHPNLKEGSEEFLKVAGERFDYIVNRTQVYDSTLSKSELMRSKSTWAKIITSFSAEPTVSYNMLMKGAQEVAMAKGANKGAAWRFFGRTVGAFAYAAMVNALLKSLVTAARKNKPDDEDDKSYIEWYAQEFIGNFLNDLNPLGLLPLVRDFVSLLEGYDLSRTDMEAVKMIADAIEAITDQDMPIEQKLGEIVKAIGIVIGVPVENIMRDAEALINVFVDIFNGWDTSWQGIGDAAQDAIAGLSRFEIAEESGNTADKLYKAMMNGDTNAYKQYYADIVEEFNKKKQEGKTDSKNTESYIRSQMRKRLVDSAEIKAAYEASEASNFAAYDAAVKALTSKGFHPNDVMSAINSYEERLKKGEASEPAVEEYEEEDVKLDKGLLVDAIANGKELEVIAAEQSKYKKGSQEYKDNAAKIKRYITQELKPQYQDAYLAGDVNTVAAIYRRLKSYGKYGIEYADSLLKSWRDNAKEDRA